MARWYQTAQANFVDDKMFQLPWQLMAQTIQAKDKAVDETIASSVSLLDKLQAQGLSADQPRLKEIMSGYEGKVNDIVGNIRKNPMEYYKYNDAIRNLGRDISKDWTIGEVAAIEGNKKAYVDALKLNEDLSKKDPEKYTQDYINALNANSLNSYSTGGGAKYNPQTGQYNNFKPGDALGLGSLNTWVDERLKDAIPDMQSITKEASTGKWIVKTSRETKSMSEEDLKKILESSLQGDTNLQNALRQRQQLGLPQFGNVVGEEGFNTTNESILGQAFQAGLEKFGFVNRTNSSTIQADPYALKDYDENLRKQREKEETDYLTWNVEGYVTGTQGTTATDFIERRNGIMNTIKNTKEEAIQLAMNEFGYKSQQEFKAKNPTAYNQILNQGKLVGTSSSPQLKRLQRQYDQSKLELAGQESFKKQFAKDTGMTYDAAMRTAQGKSMWDKYITSGGAPGTNSGPMIKVDQKMSWEPYGVNQKQIDSTNKQWVESGQYKTADLGLPKGTIVGGKDIGGKGYSINDLVRLGVVINEPVKVPVIGVKTAEFKDSEGKTIVPAQYEVQYKLADGTGTIGIDAAKGLKPITGLNDEGNIDLGFVVNVRGQEVLGRVDEATTSSIKDFKRSNDKLLRTDLMLKRWGNLENVEIPEGKGVIYHGKDSYDKVTGKKLHSKNTVSVPVGNKADGTVLYETYNANDPGVENVLSELLYGED